MLQSTKNTRAILPDSYRFVRSDVPDSLTESEIQWLINHNIVTVIDLRQDDERVRKRCPCCGYYTFYDEPGSYDICPVCFWEDDPIQLDAPEFEGGANHISLQQARINYKEFGVCEKKMLPYVRKPNSDEVKQ